MKRIVSLFFVYLVLSLSLPFVYAAPITQETANQICGLREPNPKDSFIGSAISLCLPGILEKMKEQENIKCKAAKCYYNAVVSGLDPGFCTKMEQYETCVYIQGEVFSLPGLHFAEQLREAIGNALANPAGYIYSYGIKTLREYVTNTCTTAAACESPIIGASALLLAYNDIVSAKQLLDDMAENSPWGGFPDECEGLDSIETEMKELLGLE